MPTVPYRQELVAFRNFNLCPHCIQEGKEPLLPRLYEAMPMISRSDGETFHLLLADRPLPFPLESNLEPTGQVSLLFWYRHKQSRSETHSTIVILPDLFAGKARLYRRVEEIADLLCEELILRGELGLMYEITEESLLALAS